MYISNEDLVMMEHDFITKKLAETRRKNEGQCDGYEYEFFIYAGAISDFVSELIGDKEENAKSE